METPLTASRPARAAMWVSPPPYTARATQCTPSSDLTPATGQQLWLTTLQRCPLPPPTGPGGATVGMSLAKFEAWATSVEDYSSICGWAPLMAAPYVRLLCNTKMQQCIDVRLGKHEFRQLSTADAIDRETCSDWPTLYCCGWNSSL